MDNNEFILDNFPEYKFRIKRLNAVEILALRTQFQLKNYEKSLSFFNLILSKIEVNAGDGWLTVYDGNNFFPAEAETNFALVDGLTGYFLENVLTKVFRKSGE